ncbi:hypothetical protein AAMO2058_001267000, partial [Amorphochlora amoebiformis]
MGTCKPHGLSQSGSSEEKKTSHQTPPRRLSSGPDFPAEAKRVLDFWFKGSTRENVRSKWFVPSRSERQRELDDRIGTEFGSLVEEASNGLLTDWATTPRGALAAIIILDQFSRHVYRHGPEENLKSCDNLAHRFTRALVQRGWLDKLSLPEKCFALLPLRHRGDHNELLEVLREIGKIQSEFAEHKDLLSRFRRATVR